MSRETPSSPEKIPHWSDSWQPFHDHWEEILGLPLDALAIADKEGESFEGRADMFSKMLGLPNPALERRRTLIDDLVGKGNVNITLGQASNDLREINAHRGNKDVLFSILEDIFRPFIHSRIYSGIMQELKSHMVFQAYRDKDRREFYDQMQKLHKSGSEKWEYSKEEEDFAFLSALAEALAIKLGMDNYRGWS